MLFENHKLNYGTYGFRFKSQHQQRVTGIYSIGWELETETSYDWDGLNRREESVIIFQYTLDGMGEIKVKNEIFPLQKGDAFFVKVPSEHRYYLPEHSEKWEFIYFTLFGDEAIKTYDTITNRTGNVFNLDFHSSPVSIILEVLKSISEDNLRDAYESSALAYSFLMELHRFSLKLDNDQEWPEQIARAISFIQNNYAEPISLDNIVEVTNLSKYHFTRLFQQYIKLTPIQYLKKIRINKSIELLKDQSLTVEEIAKKVGFANGNYFGKVFRSTVGLSPGEFRNNKSFSPIDHIISD